MSALSHCTQVPQAASWFLWESDEIIPLNMWLWGWLQTLAATATEVFVRTISCAHVHVDADKLGWPFDQHSQHFPRLQSCLDHATKYAAIRVPMYAHTKCDKLIIHTGPYCCQKCFAPQCISVWLGPPEEVCIIPNPSIHMRLHISYFCTFPRTLHGALPSESDTWHRSLN